MKIPFTSQTQQGKGFTLIEVAVALAISGWVLGSAVSLVKQYADERIRLREQFLGSQVAWNILLEAYQRSQGWQQKNASESRMTEGSQEQGGQDWYWQLGAKPALGQNLVRYQADSSHSEQGPVQASLSIYLLEQGRGQGGAQ